MNDKVKWFLADKGYGFVVAQNGQGVFAHYTNIIGAGYRSLTQGEAAEGPKAVNVRSLELVATSTEPAAQSDVQPTLPPLQSSLHSTVTPTVKPKRPVVFKRMPPPK